MKIVDRPDSTSVWLSGGPGPEATWPTTIGGRFAASRGEWYFPKGTAPHAILNAASVGPSPAGEEGFSDPAAERVKAREAEEDTRSPRATRVVAAVKAWTDQLVDLTARNNLLFFRDQRAGTLDLTHAESPTLFAILAGRERSLGQLITADDEAKADAARRGRAIHTRAQTIYEERGIHTLYLACGLATWDNQRGDAEPAAPVLLAPATLTPRGAARADFDLHVSGELEVNPTLLNALASEFNVECDPDDVLASAGMEGAIDTPEELEIAFRWLSQQAREVPGFAVRPKTVLGNFSYAKLPMVRDLQDSVDALVNHDLIAALAGDEEARRAIQGVTPEIDPSLPDETPPSDEFLVLDADSSQNHAINKVLAGQSLVIKGPPGTGKSQTITNLISCLVARGKSVLFVAEKRAAIDAVLKRLDQVGLDDLVLDLHGGVSSKRRVAQSLAAALETNARITQPNLGPEHATLESRRGELNGWLETLHQPREPWGHSLFGAQEQMLALGDEVETEVRLRGQVLHSLSPERVDELRQNLRDYVQLGGLQAASRSPWSGSPIETRDQAQRARELVDGPYEQRLSEAFDRLERAGMELSVPAPETVGGWRGRLQLWAGIRTTLHAFESELFEADLDQEVGRLQPLGQGAGARVSAALGDAEYRAAHARAKNVQREGVKLRKADLLDALRLASGQQEAWRQAGSSGNPHAPEDLDDLVAEHEVVAGGLSELSGLAGIDLSANPRGELMKRLRAFREDSTMLARLPDLHRLRRGLHEAGLSPLLDDLASWEADPAGAIATFEYCVNASIVDEIHMHDSRAAAFDGANHDATAREFLVADSATSLPRHSGSGVWPPNEPSRLVISDPTNRRSSDAKPPRRVGTAQCEKPSSARLK